MKVNTLITNIFYKLNFTQIVWYMALAVIFIFHVWICFWGKPYLLHVDEPFTINPAIDMISRHSWIANSYARPDQFECKIDSILFTIFSWIYYHKPAHEAFQTNPFFFHFIARCFSSLCSVLMIYFSSIFLERSFCKNNTEKIISRSCLLIFLGFGVLFVRHSAFATPDIPLAMFFTLFSVALYNYILFPSKKNLICVCIVISCAVTVKYPAGWLAFVLFIALIYEHLKNKSSLKSFLTSCAICAVTFIATVFLIAPNLISQPQIVYENIIRESRSTHLSADGLGFFGNIKFYIDTIYINFGSITFGIVLLGFISFTVNTIKNRKFNPIWIVYFSGISYLLMISSSGLHWERWGTPVYTFFVLFTVVSIVEIIRIIQNYFINKILSRISLLLFSIVVFIVFSNQIINGLGTAKQINAPERITQTIRELNKLGVNRDNSISEAYTPFSISWGLYGNSTLNHFKFNASDKPLLTNDNINKQFLIESNWYNRFLSAVNSNKHTDAKEIVNKYELIHKYYPQIYKISTEDEGVKLKITHNEFFNIYNNFYFLKNSKVYIYRICNVYDLRNQSP